MKYKEFKTEVEKLGLKVVERSDEHYVVTKDVIEWILVSVSKDIVCAMNTRYHGHMISEEIFRQLFHILVKFAQTSIEERHYGA